MLLTCCFRDAKTKKHKKNEYKKKNSLQENQDSSPPSAYQPSTPQHSPVLTVQSATHRSSQGQDRKLEKYPPSKEEKRLLKRRSQESLHRRSIISESNQSQRNSIIITDKSNIEHLTPPNLSNVSSIKGRKESLPSPPATPKYTGEYGRRCSLPQHSILSVTNLLETSTNSNNSYKHATGHILTTTPAGAGDNTSSSSTSVTQSQSSIAKTQETCPEDGGYGCGGIKRSTAFHDAELLEAQIREEEESQKKQQGTIIINEIRREHDLIIQKLKEENQLEFEKATETFNSKLRQETLKHKKDNEDAIIVAKSEAKDIITKLNQQIVLERGKLIAEQQENAKKLEEDFKMKEERLSDYVKQMNERDQAWQDERADVLKEVQRLKAEATRMVKILAMEYEEDNLSEDKKRSLSQEVYSFQLVVEMRTGEVRNLREQLARATQEVEEAEIVKEKLRKATARMEDLEEQVKMKNRLEKQLSVEKSQLEMNITNSNKAAQRMSQNVEELQWRIRNNFDVPVEVFTSPPIQHQQPSSFRGFCEPLKKNANNTGIDQNLKSTQLPGMKSELQSKERSVFSVSPEMIQSTSFDQNNSEICDDHVVTSDFSPSSDGVIEYLLEEDSEEEIAEYLHNSDMDELDGDSHDEGLGDISSDESLVPNNEIAESHKCHNNNTCEQAIIFSAKSPERNIVQKHDDDQTQYTPIIKNEKERRPSRISFETPL